WLALRGILQLDSASYAWRDSAERDSERLPRSSRLRRGSYLPQCVERDGSWPCSSPSHKQSVTEIGSGNRADVNILGARADFCYRLFMRRRRIYSRLLG